MKQKLTVSLLVLRDWMVLPHPSENCPCDRKYHKEPQIFHYRGVMGEEGGGGGEVRYLNFVVNLSGNQQKRFVSNKERMNMNKMEFKMENRKTKQ